MRTRTEIINIKAKRVSEICFLKSILASNFCRLKFPFKLSYAITYRCNLRCKMCNIWKKPCIPELTVEELDNFFKKSNKFSWLAITGGEPFLREELPQIIDLILNRFDRLCAIHFATNGTLTDTIISLTERINKKNKNIKLLFSVSIDGPCALHDNIRGVKGTWEKAINTFKYLRNSTSAQARIGFTLSDFNMDKFKDTFFSIKKVYPNLKFDDIVINIFQKSSFYYENQEAQDLDFQKLSAQIKKILIMDNDVFSVNNFLRRTYLKLYPKHLEIKKCPIKCQALSSTCFLGPYGNLYPCVGYNKALINIKNLSLPFEVLWNSKEAKLLSYECSNDICPSCWNPCDAYSAILGSLFSVHFV